MSKAKLIIAACVAMLALSSVIAASASAEWMEGGKNFGNGSKAALATTAKVTESGVLEGANLKIECTGEVLEGASPEIRDLERGFASSLTFSGCKSVTENCELEGTKISTVAILALAELDPSNTKDATVVLFTPETKSTFATFKINGTLCAASGVNAVTGKATVLAPTGALENTLQEIKAITTAASGELKLGSGAASLKGAALLRLLSGKPWSFL